MLKIKIAAVLGMFSLLLSGALIVAPSAHADTWLQRDFAVSPGAYTASARIITRHDATNDRFRPRNQNEGYAISWNTAIDGSSGKFKMNALCWDFEWSPGQYFQITCVGGSSTTLDDVSTSGEVEFASVDWYNYANQEDRHRFRFYGVGSGSVENRYDDLMQICC